MKNAISQDDVDVQYFLCSGKSFSQHEKKHHGPFNSCNINKEALENELASMPSNPQTVILTGLG